MKIDPNQLVLAENPDAARVRHRSSMLLMRLGRRKTLQSAIGKGTTFASILTGA